MTLVMGLASLAHVEQGAWGMYPPLASLAPLSRFLRGTGGMGDVSPRGMYPPLAFPNGSIF